MIDPFDTKNSVVTLRLEKVSNLPRLVDETVDILIKLGCTYNKKILGRSNTAHDAINKKEHIETELGNGDLQKAKEVLYQEGGFIHLNARMCNRDIDITASISMEKDKARISIYYYGSRIVALEINDELEYLIKKFAKKINKKYPCKDITKSELTETYIKMYGENPPQFKQKYIFRFAKKEGVMDKIINELKNRYSLIKENSNFRFKIENSEINIKEEDEDIVLIIDDSLFHYGSPIQRKGHKKYTIDKRIHDLLNLIYNFNGETEVRIMDLLRTDVKIMLNKKNIKELNKILWPLEKRCL